MGDGSDSASWIYLAVSIVGLGFTCAALVPARRIGWFAIPYFFGAWLAGELAIHHIVWQAAATVGFAMAGAFEAPAGIAGLAITVVSWLGFGVVVQRARAAGDVTEIALRESLGRDYGPSVSTQDAPAEQSIPVEQLMLPFRMRHPDVEVTRGIAYGEAGKRNLLDVYHPRFSDGPCPTLLQIHGGGWMIGNKEEQGGPLMRYLAARGWCCVAINYRLSPSATWPEHLIDCKRALAWIRENGAAHGADPDLVVVTGGSAGGHLSSMVALTANRPEYQPGFEDVDTSVAACVPFYGVYDFLSRHGADPDNRMADVLERYVLKCSPQAEAERWRLASPIDQIGPEAPPFYVIHGTHDTLAFVEDARAFVRALRGVSQAPVAYAELPGGQHAFDVFHSIRTEHTVRSVWKFLEHVRARRVARGPVAPTGPIAPLPITATTFHTAQPQRRCASPDDS
ncbi:MAG: alpha/beta hydrolase [Myxococcales bacterium]|nr:MAG: alpha/beta hydrolase [Myxococcales bacterium]